MRIALLSVLAVAVAIAQPFPAGIKFKVSFTQPVDTSKAAVGDRIKGMLLTPIRGVAKEGSPVTAQVVAIEHVSSPETAVRLEVRLDSVKAEANPARDSNEVYPPGPKARSISGTTLFFLGTAFPHPLRGRVHDDSSVYVWEFRTGDAVLEAGVVSSWITSQ
jgi:hypothetical protein